MTTPPPDDVLVLPSGETLCTRGCCDDPPSETKRYRVTTNLVLAAGLLLLALISILGHPGQGSWNGPGAAIILCVFAGLLTGATVQLIQEPPRSRRMWSLVAACVLLGSAIGLTVWGVVSATH
jgi:hypothetical protein